MSMSQHASPHGSQGSSSGYLSMEIRPPPSEGKGGEVPLLHRPLSLLEPAQRGLCQDEFEISSIEGNHGSTPALVIALDSLY